MMRLAIEDRRDPGSWTGASKRITEQLGSIRGTAHESAMPRSTVVSGPALPTRRSAHRIRTRETRTASCQRVPQDSVGARPQIQVIVDYIDAQDRLRGRADPRTAGR